MWRVGTDEDNYQDWLEGQGWQSKHSNSISQGLSTINIMANVQLLWTMDVYDWVREVVEGEVSDIDKWRGKAKARKQEEMSKTCNEGNTFIK